MFRPTLREAPKDSYKTFIVVDGAGFISHAVNFFFESLFAREKEGDKATNLRNFVYLSFSRNYGRRVLRATLLPTNAA